MITYKLIGYLSICIGLLAAKPAASGVTISTTPLANAIYVDIKLPLDATGYTLASPPVLWSWTDTNEYVTVAFAGTIAQATVTINWVGNLIDTFQWNYGGGLVGFDGDSFANYTNGKQFQYLRPPVADNSSALMLLGLGLAATSVMRKFA